MRRLFIAFAASWLLVAGWAGTASAAQEPTTFELPADWPEGPEVTARSYLLVDAVSGQPLAGRIADTPRPVASTVKILTALTVLRHAHPSTVVTVGEEVRDLEGASVGLRPGDRWSVQDLLEALLVRSGNDAAVALAVHVGGSVEGFVRMMRTEAAEQGLDDVVLVTPSGLEDANRLSAGDVAVLARVAMQEPAFADIVGDREVAIPTDGSAETRNLLLGTYRGATGIKTGYTERSGWSVVASAERQGRALIAVVLGASGHDERFEDAAALLDHGFTGFVGMAVSDRIELRVGGGAVSGTIRGSEVLVPRGSRLEVALTLPVQVEDLPSSVPVLWEGSRLTDAVVEVDHPERPDLSGGGALSRALHDRLYTAMRAATAAGAWPVPGH